MSDEQKSAFPTRFAEQMARITAAAKEINEPRSCEFCTDPDGEPCFPTYGLAPHIPTEPNGIRGHKFVPLPVDGFIPDPDSPTHGTYYCTHCGSGKCSCLSMREKAEQITGEPDCLASVDYDSWTMAKELAAVYLADLAAREAEQLERAKPIDEEWLESHGYRRDHHGEWSCRHIALRRLADGSWGVFIVGGVDASLYIGTQFKTCGDLLDLMTGLKIPTKEGAK